MASLPMSLQPVPRRLSTRRPNPIAIAKQNVDLIERLNLVTERCRRMERMVRALTGTLRRVRDHRDALVEWSVTAREQHELTLTALCFAVDVSVLGVPLRLHRDGRGVLCPREYRGAVSDLPEPPLEVEGEGGAE